MNTTLWLSKFGTGFCGTSAVIFAGTVAVVTLKVGEEKVEHQAEKFVLWGGLPLRRCQY